MIYYFEDLTFRPIMVDRFLHKTGQFDVKARRFAALSFRLGGTGSFELCGRQLLSAPGDVLFLPAGMPYRVEYSNNSEIVVVHLEQCNYFEAESIHLRNAAPTEARFLQLLDAWNDKRSVNQAKSILYDLLEKIAEDQKQSNDDASFFDCVSYMDTHFCDPSLSIERVCKQGFISASTLQRKFYAHFGMSPKQYLLKLRMNRALDLLLANESSVKDVAFACGFSDEKYFSRAFCKRYGYPPSQLQNQIQI